MNEEAATTPYATKYPDIAWEMKRAVHTAIVGRHKINIFLSMHDSEAGWKTTIDGTLMSNHPACLDEAKNAALEALETDCRRTLALLGREH